MVQVNPIDGMKLVLIPSGEFLMGSNSEDDPYFWGAEGPQHPVYLDEYWMYRTEVTNAMYQQCVEVQACPRPDQTYSATTSEYYDNPLFADYPVIYVSYNHAISYCRWAGGRLPTEAEWEKAARGTEGQLFPWGDLSPGPEQVNLCDQSCARGAERESGLLDGFPGIAPVGSFDEGASPYGLLDMAGNVWEWTFDWFQATFYSVSPYENPDGPVSGSSRVMRGGSWTNSVDGVRAVARVSLSPDKSLDTLGFRCVVDAMDDNK
jgi:formylglycine-generating enzyme required for sulfatase activity